MDGRDMAFGKGLGVWADANNVNLVGSFFEDINPDNIEGYADAKGGSGQALLDYLKKKGMENLPIFLWGFSAGGQFCYEFACWRPELVKSFVANKGGFYYTALAPPATRQIPGLLFTGQFDAHFRQAILTGIFLMNMRDKDCNWQHYPEMTGHDPGNSLGISLDHFADILTKF